MKQQLNGKSGKVEMIISEGKIWFEQIDEPQDFANTLAAVPKKRKRDGWIIQFC